MPNTQRATVWASLGVRAFQDTGLSSQEDWSGLPLPPPGELPDPGIEPGSPAWQVDCSPLSHQGGPPENQQCRERETRSWGRMQFSSKQ